MKKFFYIQLFIFFSIIQVNALCPLESDGESVCSMQNFKESSFLLFKSGNMNSNMNSNAQSSNTTLQPYNNEQSAEQMKFTEQNNNPNLNCQFGLCPQNFNNQVQQK